MLAPARSVTVVVAVLAGVVAFADAACVSQPPAHRTHLGAVLDLPNTEVALDDTPAQGRTDDDRGKAQKLMADGARLRDEGDLPGSQRALEQALQLDASLARAHVEWALTAEGLGVDSQLIAAHYQLGARLAPDDPRAQTLAAAWAARQGDFDRALEGYDKALAVDPKSVEALCRRADVLVARGDQQAAVASYQKALEVDARWVPALIGMMDAAEKAGALDVAERAGRQLVALFPEATLYRTRLIAFYRRTHQTAKASAAQKELERLQPKDTRRLRNLRR